MSVWSLVFCFDQDNIVPILCGRGSTKCHLSNTVRIWRAGLHLSLRMSRQILPSYRRRFFIYFILRNEKHQNRSRERSKIEQTACLVNVRVIYFGEEPNLQKQKEKDLGSMSESTMIQRNLWGSGAFLVLSDMRLSTMSGKIFTLFFVQ